jgi:peptidyl-dipeptidase Dcp
MPADTSPLLEPWSGPFGGTPPFDAVGAAGVAGLAAALRAAMELRRGELRAIAASPEPPTFANTIGALERAGRAFVRVHGVYETLTATMSDRAMQDLELEMAPALAAFADELTQDAAIFARVAQVYEARATAGLADDELRLLETTHRQFVRRGAALAGAAKARLGELNQRLASLYTTFGQHVLADEEDGGLWLADDADVAGLPASLVAALRAAAEAKGGRAPYLVANTRSSAEPFLTLSPRRELRERVFQMFASRGERTNWPVISEILARRHERARLLGFASHAHWTLDDNMARTPEVAMALMRKVWVAAVARANAELVELQRVADADGVTIAPWDHRFYAEQVRSAKYDLDQAAIKPYLELGNIRDAMFWVAAEVYGLAFARVAGVPVYHPDVTVYEVTRGGAHVGLWYFDPYARDGKRSGAWMSEYRTQERFAAPVAPIVSNNANFVRGQPGDPVLISWDDATTMFHEFGHALHGLLSNVRFASLAGTNTLRDFVELPSQLHEHWLATPEVLSRFARHYQTGAPIPDDLVAKLRRAKHWGQGFKTVEYLAAAIYDLEIHMAGGDVDPAAFERTTLAEIGMPSAIVMRHRPPQFSHVFATDSYAAGYYAYLWADTLTADVAEAFEEAGSFYDRAVATRLHDTIMSVGNAVPPASAFRAFRGRDVDTDALMRDRGLV